MKKRKDKKNIATVVLMLVSIVLCTLSACKENPRYGEPIFGTVVDPRPIVQTTHGHVMGENREGVAIFRGIPYGADCDGEYRFKEPRPAENWEGVKDCTKNGFYAMQEGCSISASPGALGNYFNGGHPELFGTAEEQQNENCLVLNVLSPGLDNEKRPVVVYIHGGGFATGSGTLVLGADKWAREENLVIVGVNHRLNAFGYLYLGCFDSAYASSGMAGMLDLVLALQWVKDNISRFGGDPSQVTIMGESGGGMKVSTLMTMGKAKGLFQKAIVESGSGVVGNFSVEQATKETKKLLNKLQIEEADWRKLLTIPADSLKWKLKDVTLQPVADQINLNYQADKHITASDISKHVPLLVGSSADEFGVFLPYGKMGITWENIREQLLAGGLLEEQNVDTVLKVFKETNLKNDDAEHTFVKIQSLSHFLGGGSYHQALAKALQGSAPVYHYFIEYDTPSTQTPELSCAWHTADLPLQMRIVLHSEMEPLSKMMAHAWAAFIRTGNPSTNQLPWPEFTEKEPQVMVFDHKTRVETDPLRPIREVLRKNLLFN